MTANRFLKDHTTPSPSRPRSAGTRRCRSRRGRRVLPLAFAVAALALSVALFSGRMTPRAEAGPGVAVPQSASGQPASAAGLPAPTPVAGAPTPALTVNLPGDPPVSQGTLLVRLPWGDGPGEVGLQKPAEGLGRGPEALAIAPDGRIAVLDSVNHRIDVLSAQGTPLSTIPVDLPEPRFLAVGTTGVYVLDCDAGRRVQGWDWDGTQTFSSPLALPTDQPVTNLILSGTQVLVEVGHESVFPVAGGPNPTSVGAAGGVSALQASVEGPSALPGRPADSSGGHFVQARFKPGDQPRMRLLDATGRSLPGAPREIALSTTKKLEFLVSVDPIRPVQESAGSAPAGGDATGQATGVDVSAAGGLIVGARIVTSPAGENGAPGLLVARVSLDTADGSPSAIMLREGSYVHIGQPYVVGPDGVLYQPLATDEGYSIYIHNFDRGGSQ
jgi:hypothetical protein